MAKVDVGDAAPDFELPGTGGKTYRLSDYRGRNVVLAFYPGDCTRVCTKQFCSYRDKGERIEGLDADVLGISPQSVDSHERWARRSGSTCRCSPTRTWRSAKSYGVTGWLGPLASFTELGGRAGRPLRDAGDLRDRRRGGRPPPPRLADGQQLPDASATSSGPSPRLD